MDEKAKLIRDYTRMCDSKVGIGCDGCELNKNKKHSSCKLFMMKEPEQAVDIIEKWAAEHPAKTRQSEFLKIFPNARIVDGAITIEPSQSLPSAVRSLEICNPCVPNAIAPNVGLVSSKSSNNIARTLRYR